MEPGRKDQLVNNFLFVLGTAPIWGSVLILGAWCTIKLLTRSQ